MSLYLDLKKSCTRFRNFVTFEIDIVKKDYYTTHYDSCKDNQAEKWKFIKELVNKKAVSSLPSVLKAGGKEILDPIDICHKLQQLHYTLSLISAKI